MTTGVRKSTGKIALAILAIFMAGIFCRSEALAQRFQYLYGGICTEAARGGVQQAAGGGYVFAGQTNTPTACGATDIYVVRTLNNGAISFSFAYNIGGNDSATAIRQCANGDFIITGVTDNTGSSCAPSRDIFLLRLNNGGGIIWLATYGSTRDEIAWDVIETKTGDGVNTKAGDFVVAGSTNVNSGTGRDGYLLRATSAGGLIWDAYYGGPNSQDEYFHGLDEADVPAPVGTAADIVAVGGSTTWGTNLNVFVVRVNGNAGAVGGTIGAAPQGGAIYGGSNLDEGRSIQTLRTGASAGNFIIAGITHSRPAPSTNSEIYVLQINPYPCSTPVADLYMGDNGGGADGGLDIQQITVAGVPGLTTSNLVVTGFTAIGNATIPGPNVFLQELTPAGTLPRVGPFGVYGGNGTDWGWSVGVCSRNIAPETPGFVIAGFSQSANLLAAGDPQDAYLIKTNTAKQSGCNEALFTGVSAGNPKFPVTCVTPFIGRITRQCNRLLASSAVTPSKLLCYFSPSTKPVDNGGNDGVSGVGEEAAAPEGILSSYPNPVKSGEAITIEYLLTREDVASVTVVDMLGATVHTARTTGVAGRNILPVSTSGWSSGSYIIRLEAEGKSYSMRFVVVDR